METIGLNHSDLLLLIMISSGILAGVLAYLMIPSTKREMQNCLKSVLFGMLFALMSSVAVQFLFEDTVQGIPVELRTLFLWCASFLPSFVLTLAYGVVARRQGKLEL